MINPEKPNSLLFVLGLPDSRFLLNNKKLDFF